MRTFINRLYRNRRRAMICCAGFMFIGFFGGLSHEGEVHVGRAVGVALLTGVMMTAVLSILAAAIDRYRFMMETAGVAIVVFPLTHALMPDFENSALELLPLGVGYAVCFGLIRLYSTPMLDTKARRSNVEAKGNSRSALPIEAVWEGLYDHPSAMANRSTEILSCAPVDGQPDTFRIRERNPDGPGEIEEIKTELLRDAPHTYRFEWRTTSAPVDDAFNSGMVEVTLRTDKRGKTRVCETWTLHSYSARMALFAWVDDHFGRAIDDKLALLR